MKWIIGLASLLLLFYSPASGQSTRKVTKFPAGVPVKDTGVEAAGGTVEGRKYTNKRFGFVMTLPENWFIAGPDFDAVIKEKGYDLRVEGSGLKTSRNIEILMTAFTGGSPTGQSAILRVTAEDLRQHPQIKDGVDYFDAITAAFMATKLPPDFSYSATKAEQLGPNQFAYLDTNSGSGKKRMYATVRGRYAIMFTLSYISRDDLEAVRGILAAVEYSAK